MEAQATETVKQALAALYHHPDDGIRTAADRWLQEFQHTLDAWQVADSLLHDESSNLETLIFCSQTLRSKVQRDFEELPSEAFRSLQDSLYVLLKKFNKGPPKVRTQICIAIAALAVHVPVEDWGAGGIVNWLSDEMKAHPEFIPGFLELLIVLPQETSSYKIAARPERRRQFESDLCSSANVAINLLTACMAIDQLKEQVNFLLFNISFYDTISPWVFSQIPKPVLEGFSSWLRFCHGISASELASHPLVHMALSSLNSDQFLEAAVNVTSELIHATVSHGSGTTAEQMPLIQLLVPQIMGLKEQLKDPSKDEEDVKAIARLFADMGESYVDLIATGSDDSIQIVIALLEVTSHLEFDIYSMTFNFWHRLKRNLIRRESYVSYGSEVAIQDERNRRLQIFCPRFENLVSLAYGSCNNEQNPKWQPVEAALFCIQAIAKSVSIEEREILPQVRTCGRAMGMTIGAVLEEIQTLYQQHKQSCFLYLSSEVIKIFGSDPSCAGYLTNLIQILFSHTVQLLRTIQDFTARPDIADDCYLLASRCIRYCPDLFVPTEMFQRLVDCAMAGITIQHREACKSILSFLSDVFDLPNSSEGGNYREFINTIVLQRGATLTRIMIAALTGALPSGRLEEVSYVLLSLSRTYGENMLNWARESINLIPPQALTDAERLRFLNIISDAASGSSLHTITDRLGEISDVCRRNKTVQDLVQSALRPHDLSFTVVPQQLS
ncbi:Transportin MOS14 [Dichanthelium oligosanthes]|uniref:Transportin MOS14 n=1 Tax=Dichanthelium oligosanthes TaxID=888268 RepID=A0A1E5V7G1_9POAL|nr:Transportin MOS14 [Dichanthelium oligosanthes]